MLAIVMLVRGLRATARAACGGYAGVMASLPPIIYAAVLFVRGRRFPAPTD